jgi:hypothetical protein
MLWKHLVGSTLVVGVALSALANEAVLGDGWHKSDPDERVSFFDLKPSAGFSPFDPIKTYSGKPSTIEDFAFLLDIQRDLQKKKSTSSEASEVRAAAVAVHVEETTLSETKVNETDVSETKVEPRITEVRIPDHLRVDTGPRCDQLIKLEPLALMGRLSEEQIECLESRITASRRMTEKEKISRVLMSNAFSSGNGRYNSLLKRHLEDIDRSDPDLAYKYAYSLHKKGVSRSKGVIRWSDVALERKDRWDETVYARRVYTTMKIRAFAAYRLWEAAEKADISSSNPESRTLKDKRRSQAKVYAREWVEYATASNQEQTSAVQLCVSVAGAEEYCT